MTLAISATGLALIRKYEGFSARPTPLPDGNWVVGHGHVRIGEAGGSVSKAEAAHLLALDLAPIERVVNAKVTTPLAQSQFDALVSFVFSIGEAAFAQSQVLRRLNKGDFIAAACAMDAWRKSEVSGEPEIVSALVARRAVEKALFLKGLAFGASPSALLRAKLDYAASMLGAPSKSTLAPAPADPARLLTAILKSEPATEALLLTQVAPALDENEEITTAHAKPVARPLQTAERPRFAPPRIPVMRSMENAGLIALLLFGLGLIVIAGSMMLAGKGDLIDIAAGAAIATPGLAASLMAGFGLWRGPVPVKA